MRGSAPSRLSAAQDQITALGDPVNVGSRVEVGKQRGRAVVVSEDLVAAAGERRRE
jgi:class 3 adenylate cyclase